MNLLLLWIRPLHRLLLKPFIKVLRGDASLETFNKEAFFAGLQVVAVGLPLDSLGQKPKPMPIAQALGGLRGKFILQGESGLGKTMYARWLIAEHPERINAFLRAELCSDGVVEALMEKLPDFINNRDRFLRQLIFGGAIDVYIDGLNEVSPDVREKVGSFLEQSGACNVLVTMQPLQWAAPQVAKVYELLPLEDKAIGQCLLKQAARVLADCDCSPAEYEQRRNTFLDRVLDDGLSPDEQRANREILSNPMELSIVALLLAKNKSPHLGMLQEQRYTEMANYYQRNNNGEPFPLPHFVEMAYAVLRLSDRRLVTNQLAALEALLAYKMVVRRQVKGASGATVEEWRFRHDTVIEYFAVQKFLPKAYLDSSYALWRQHLDDTRFRGVFLLLAVLLKPDDAKLLGEHILDRAVERGDHTLSDEYLRRLKRRGLALLVPGQDQAGSDRNQRARPRRDG